MRILVTGATGLLGNHICTELFQSRHDVKVLVRATSDLRAIEDIPCEHVYGDLSNEKDIVKALEGVDGVIHCAAVVASGVTSFSYYEDINLKATIRLVHAMQRSGCKRLLFVSTANTIGCGTKENPGTELSGFSLLSYNSGYVNSKYLAEQFILENNGKKGLDAVIVNPTFIIGPKDYKPSSGQLILYGLKNKVQFYPPGGKNFVYVKDAAKGACLAFFYGKSGQKYLLAGDNLSYLEFFHKLGQISGVNSVKMTIPKSIFYLAGFAGTIISKISHKKPKLNFVNARMLSLNNYYCGEKGRIELGIPKTPIETAIMEALEWFQANNYINLNNETFNINCEKEITRNVEILQQ